MMMLGNLFQDVVREFPQKVALRCGHRAVTYSQLQVHALRVARALLEQRLDREAYVALLLPNGMEFVQVFWGCALAGVPVLPLDPCIHIDALKSCLKDARPALLITDAEGYAEVRASRDELGGSVPPMIDAQAWEVLGPSEADHLGQPLATTANVDSPAVYLWTSGSSGEPERVCRSHRQLCSEASNFVGTAGLGKDEHFLGVLPLHHSYGLEVCLLGAVMARTTLVLLHSYDAEGRRIKSPFVARCGEVVSLISAEGIRFFPGVPQQFLELAQLPEEAPADLSGLKLVMSSASPLPRSTFDRFLKRFGKPLRQSYGSTEAGTVTLNLDPEALLQPESAGVAVRNVFVRVANATGDTLPSREVGDVLIRTPVAALSANGKGQSVGGYYRSGDRGYLDEAGRLYIVGRTSALIDTGGYKVDPRRVEQALLEHPAVRDVAVYSEPADGIGQVIVAAVAADTDCDVSELTAFAAKKLAPFEMPRKFAVLSAIPRGALGKAQTAEVRRAVRAQGAPANGAEPSGTIPVAPLAHELGACVGNPRDVLLARIRAKVADMLGLELEKVSTETRLQDIGFDSLRATEFRAWLEGGLGVHVPITIIWNSPTLLACAGALLEIARAGSHASSKAVSAPERREGKADVGDLQGLIRRLDQVTDLELINQLSTGRSLGDSGWRS